MRLTGLICPETLHDCAMGHMVSSMLTTSLYVKSHQPAWPVLSIDSCRCFACRYVPCGYASCSNLPACLNCNITIVHVEVHIVCSKYRWLHCHRSPNRVYKSISSLLNLSYTSWHYLDGKSCCTPASWRVQSEFQSKCINQAKAKLFVARHHWLWAEASAIQIHMQGWLSCLPVFLIRSTCGMPMAN